MTATDMTIGASDQADSPSRPVGDGVAVVTPLGTLRNWATGVGQIFLQENWLTGLLIVAGIASYSPQMALATVLGVIVSTVSARLVGLSTDHGLQGFCGALVGAAAWMTFGTGWASLAPVLLATLLGAAACPAVTEALAWLLGHLAQAARADRLPVLTAPFCVASGLLALIAKAVVPAAALPAPAADHSNPAWQFVKAVLTAVGQVVFAGSWIGGGLILIGLFVAGWRVGLAALAGSLAGVLTGLATGTSLADSVQGLNGFNAVLVVIAVSAVFLKPGWQRWVIGLIGAVASVGVRWLLLQTAIPGYTWPFILTTWVILLIFARPAAPAPVSSPSAATGGDKESD